MFCFVFKQWSTFLPNFWHVTAQTSDRIIITLRFLWLHLLYEKGSAYSHGDIQLSMFYCSWARSDEPRWLDCSHFDVHLTQRLHNAHHLHLHGQSARGDVENNPGKGLNPYWAVWHEDWQSAVTANAGIPGGTDWGWQILFVSVKSLLFQI